MFDDTGSTAPAVNLAGSLQPASVSVNASKQYTLSGTGSLDGAMVLNKAGGGTLLINTTNRFAGPTTVSNGTLLVHGALTASPVTVRQGATLGGNGRLGSSVSALSGSTLTPGNGIGVPGTLTITNTLVLSGGVTVRFDLSDDPSGNIKTNDIIRVFGNLSVSGTNVLKFSLLDGLPGNGVYTLIAYSGTFSGGLTNFSLSGINGTLTNPPGAIAIIVNATRPPAALVWAGNGANNAWDTGTTIAWLNDGAPDRFYFLDDVVFDNTGSINSNVTLVGDLTPSSVTVRASASYTMSGGGRITGTTGLTKTNSGTLTILTTNDYTGATSLGGGVLSVARLANAGAASGIGAAGADPVNLVLSGGILRYTGSSTTSDRGATFNGAGGTFDVASAGSTLTWAGTNVGNGVLAKSGAGTLVLSANNSFSGGTVLSNGVLALDGPAGGGTVTANNYSLGSGSVTFYGGTLKLFGSGLSTTPSYGTFSRPMIIPAGATGTLLTPPRYTLSSSLSGGGTLNLEVNYVRGTLSGNWSGFTGIINVTGRIADSEFRVANSYGYAGAALFLNDNAVITRSGSAITVEMGSLGGTSGSRIGPGNSTSSGSSYRIGWNNQDATFAGRILADGVNTITKVGTGNWTLTGANTYTGGTVVDRGTLTVNNSSGSGTGTAAVTVNTNATLAGTGTISGAVTVNSGGTLAPGSGGVGALTINNSLTLANGARLAFDLGATAASDKIIVSGALALGGTLRVTNATGFSAGTYLLISYGGALTGTAPTLGSMPAGYTGSINMNTPGQVQLTVQLAPLTPPTIRSITVSGDSVFVSGTGGPPNGIYYVVTATNVGLPMANWTPASTNQFDAAGAFTFTNVLDPNTPQRFFRLSLP